METWKINQNTQIMKIESKTNLENCKTNLEN